MVKEKFNINNLLNDVSLGSVKKQKLNYKSLVPHEKNFYSVDDIDDLVNDIQDNGLLQNLVVQHKDKDTYRIIVGHRRHLAVTKLVEERGLDEFKSIDCYVLPKDENPNLTELKLHNSNITQRKLSDYEKMQAITELKRIYNELKKEGVQIKGTVSSLVADTVGLKPTQVKKYMSIQKNAPDEVLEQLEHNEITVEEAYLESRSKSKKENMDTNTIDTEKPLKMAKKSINKLKKDVELLLNKKIVDQNVHNEVLELINSISSKLEI